MQVKIKKVDSLGIVAGFWLKSENPFARILRGKNWSLDLPAV
jgi:hypothetical protein